MSLYKFKEKFETEFIYDITSTLKLREQFFQEVEKVIEEKLEDSSKYLENHHKKKYDIYLTQKLEKVEERGINMIEYEELEKNMSSRYINLGLSLSSSSYYDICKTYFYCQESKNAFVHSNLLYKFFFDQFGENSNEKIFDHNIILLNLLSLTKDPSHEKGKIFYKLVTKMVKPTIRNFLVVLRKYLENNIFGVVSKLLELTEQKPINYRIGNYMKENKDVLDNVITDILNEILNVYELKDMNEDQVYLVEESECSVIFKNKHVIFNFEELWRYCLERVVVKKINC
jgi:hypothetical protein